MLANVLTVVSSVCQNEMVLQLEKSELTLKAKHEQNENSSFSWVRVLRTGLVCYIAYNYICVKYPKQTNPNRQKVQEEGVVWLRVGMVILRNFVSILNQLNCKL